MPEVSHSVVRLSVCADDVPRASGERAIAAESAAAAPHSVGRSRARRAYVRRYFGGVGRENRWAYRFGGFSECVFTTILFGCENQFADLVHLTCYQAVARRPVEQHCIGGKQQ